MLHTLSRTAALVAACTSIPASAQDAPSAGFGRPDCRIAAVSPAPSGMVNWKGGCKDGFAEGQGELSWKDANGKTWRLEGLLARGVVQGEAGLSLPGGALYSGTFKDGVPDGKGIFLDAAGTMYEGDFRHGERTGNGVGVSAVGDRYEGQWLDGVPEGQGRMKYALGGEYTGQWHAGKRHGHGVLTYAGSGRRFEGEFADGRIAGSAPAPVATRTYEAVTETGNGGYLPREIARGSPLPPDKGYAAFTPEEKRLFHSYYPALEEGDEPPYPLEGPQKFYEMMARITTSLRLQGDVMIYANVSADGKVATVGMAGVDNQDLRARAAAAAGAIKYKPAVCRGQPCAMRFPYRLRLKLE